MAKFKLIISDNDGKSQVVELEGDKAQVLIGKKIGESINGFIFGIRDSKLKVTGGSDKDGFPMRPNVHGGVRKPVLLSGGVGFRPRVLGQRKRKMVRGNVITEEIVQVNLKIIKD